MSEFGELPLAVDENGTSSREQSPFETATITEGYPFDDAEQEVIDRVLKDVRDRQEASVQPNSRPSG